MEQRLGVHSDAETAAAEAQGIGSLEPQEAEALGSPETDGAQALAEFNGLMASCGEVIVESPRLPGVPLPLQALMNACPEPVTEENAHKFLAEARSLLAARQAIEDEEVNEEEGTEEEAEPPESKKTELAKEEEKSRPAEKKPAEPESSQKDHSIHISEIKNAGSASAGAASQRAGKASALKSSLIKDESSSARIEKHPQRKIETVRSHQKVTETPWHLPGKATSDKLPTVTAPNTQPPSESKEQPTPFIELLAVDTPIVSAETDAIEIIGSDQLVPRPNDQEIQTEQPEGLYEIIAPESSEDGPRDRTGQESAYTEPTFSPEEPDGETDGLEAEMPLSFTAESHPADIYADQEPAVSLGQAEDLLSLLAESVDECRALGDESLDGVLDEIVTKIEAISASADTAPEVPDIFRYEATGTMFEQEAAENLEELEELFPLLIEAVSAERSPKLVKLFVRLTAVQAEMGTKRAGENRKPAAGGIGTHETIRQLILTLKSMNSIQDRLRHIGDSAIRLFLGFDTPPGSKRLLQVV